MTCPCFSFQSLLSSVLLLLFHVWSQSPSLSFPVSSSSALPCLSWSYLTICLFSLWLQPQRWLNHFISFMGNPSLKTYNIDFIVFFFFNFHTILYLVYGCTITNGRWKNFLKCFTCHCQNYSHINSRVIK